MKLLDSVVSLMDVKTKLVATLGPSSDSKETIKSLIDAGCDLARINMSHGKWEEHKKKIDIINELADRFGKLPKETA